MRLPSTAHTSRPWRIHAIAPDFRLEDVWAVPTPGGPDDFPRLVGLFTGGGGAAGGPSVEGGSGAPGSAAPGSPEDGFITSPVARALFAIRWKLGALFGWDDPKTGLGARVPSLRDRLPQDLRERLPQDLPPSRNARFDTVYETHDEWVAEMANRTVHGILHLGWVPDGSGGYRGQLAVLVRPNGFFGHLYMAGIKPFRYLGVYENMLRTIGARWRAQSATAPRP
ncbi:DUF2867 domain-containing protein [Streptomyces sp. NRRL S-87]|uniref:DUF2867 domain-containing protein n=1 Tax=Streptomyces sp. NRRL S-87 TaxID=1463920 RepID=UPI0004C03B8F|nr:DUF2867 domain-containing protein [Streptomyces sp. NRRL S-87]